MLERDIAKGHSVLPVSLSVRHTRDQRAMGNGVNGLRFRNTFHTIR